MNQFIEFEPGMERVFLVDSDVRIRRRSGDEIRNYAARGFSFSRREGELTVRLNSVSRYEGEADTDVPLLTIEPAATLSENDQIHYTKVSSIAYRSMGSTCGIVLTCDGVEYAGEHVPDPGERETKTKLKEALAVLLVERERLESDRMRLSEQISQLRSENAERQRSIDTANADVEAERQRKQVLQEQFDKSNEESEKLREENARNGSRNLVLQASTDKLKTQAENLKSQYQAELDRQNELNSQLAEYSPEKTQALKERNTEIARQIVEAKERYQELLDAYEPLKKEMKYAESQNVALQQQIDEQPEELRELQRNFEELSRRLEQIRTAIEMCSEEKQEELRRTISELQPQADRLTKEYRLLTKERETLERSCEQKESDNSVAVDDVLRLMTETCFRLEGSLNRAAERRDNLTASLDRLSADFEECRQWLDSVESPLLQMIQLSGLGSDEFEELNRTLNVDECSNVRNDLRVARECLTRLDEILQSASNSVRNDDKKNERRARFGEGNE